MPQASTCSCSNTVASNKRLRAPLVDQPTEPCEQAGLSDGGGAIGVTYGHGDEHEELAFGKPDDPKKSARIVQVVMREQGTKMMFIPNQI